MRREGANAESGRKGLIRKDCASQSVVGAVAGEARTAGTLTRRVDVQE